MLRAFYKPPPELVQRLEGAGASRAEAAQAALRMRSEAACLDYVGALRERARLRARRAELEHAIRTVQLAAPGVGTAEAVDALRAYPDPHAALAYVRHKRHHAPCPECPACVREFGAERDADHAAAQAWERRLAHMHPAQRERYLDTLRRP